MPGWSHASILGGMDYTRFIPRQLMLLVAALTVFAMWNVAPAGASLSIGPSNGVLKVTGNAENDSIRMRVSKSDPSMLEFDVDGDGNFDGTVPLGSFSSIFFDMGAGID